MNHRHMSTYTLDQLVFFTDTGMERPAMLRAMRSLGIDDDACFALGSSDSTRDRNVVRLYQDYGDAYGAQLERYIDSAVAAQPALECPGAPRYSLGQLAWLHAVGLFKEDMQRDMQAIGTRGSTATLLAAAAAEHRTILGLWKAHRAQHALVLENYLQACMTSYPAGWPHQAKPGAFAEDELAHPAP